MAIIRRKLVGEYAKVFGRDYAKIPKSVFAAIAFSYASHGGDDYVNGVESAINEWWTLYENGIVAQKPTKPKTNIVAK